MAIVINGSGTVTGLAVGGLPDGTVDNDTVASGLVSSKLTGALPAISAASLTNVPKDVTVGGRKNIVMNGAFQVWQRGTSFTANDDTFGADRWAIERENQTVTKEIASIGNIRCNSMKMLKTGSGAITAYHSIEDGTGVSAGGSLFNGKTLTLSYYAKASGSFDNNGQIWLYYNNNSSSVQVATCTDSLTTSWTKFTHTFTMPTNTQTYANVYSLTLSLIRALDGNVSNSDWVEVAQVQLEESSVATNFEHRSYGEELALCQRYYYLHAVGEHQPIGMTVCNSSAFFDFNCEFRTTMRASPSLEHVNGTDHYAVYHRNTSDAFDTFATRYTSPNSALFYTNGGNTSGYGTLGDGGVAFTDHANARIAFTAEL